MQVLDELRYLRAMGIPVLVVDNHDSFVYNLVQLLREDGRLKLTIARNDELPLASLSHFKGIVLSPGPGLPHEAGMMMELLAATVYTHSILGVCLGHQAICEQFGGQLMQLSEPLHGVATSVEILGRSTLWQGIPSGMTVGRYHSWTVRRDNIPDSLRVTSQDSQLRVLSLEHMTLPVYGVQFHPESYITHCGAQLIRNWIDEMSCCDF